MQLVTRAEVEEWLKHHVTNIMLHVLEQERDRAYQQRSEAFFAGEPNKTQEARLMYLTEEGTMQDFLEFFQGSIETFFHEGNGVEIVGDKNEK